MARWKRCWILLVGILSAALLLSVTAFAQDVEPSAGTSPTARPDPSQASRERLLNLIPMPLPAQSRPQGAATFYTPETLYQYMDGGADIYVLYTMETMLHQEFRAGEAEVTVDIFDMGVDDNAFGIYASERSPSYEFIAIGTEGYRNQGIVNFLQGRYYVKLGGYGSGVDALLDQFARAISGRIGGPTASPDLLELLPQANRKARSEQYLPKDPLGHSFLGPAYLVSYVIGGQESTLLLSVASSPAEAAERMNKLADHFRKSGHCAQAPELGEGAIRAGNSFEGNVIASSKGRYVLVLFAPAAASETLFKEALQRVK